MLNLLARKPEFLGMVSFWVTHRCYALRPFHVDVPTAPCAHCDANAAAYEDLCAVDREWDEEEDERVEDSIIREIEFMIAEK